LALIEGCRHELDISISAEEVEAEIARVLSGLQKRARLPGFRPGKAPATLIRRQFQEDIRQQVLESLIPKHLNERFRQESLNVVGVPDIRDVHFKNGEPLRFRVEFEVVPDFELEDYKNLTVAYADPEVSEEDVARRLEEIREQKADYANVEPRPIAQGDHAAVSLHSLSGAEPPIRHDETMLHVGGPDTLPAFTENLTGLSPGEEREFEVSYPEGHFPERLAGQTVRFRARVKGIRRRELPELNDEFAQDVGDYRTVEELREAVRKSLLANRQQEARAEAKGKLVEQLIDSHDFPVPEAYTAQQLKKKLQRAVDYGLDVNDSETRKKFLAAERERAVREVKASLLLSRIADREAIHATPDDVDREVERIARQRREAFAGLRVRLEKDGTLGRIADHIRTEKTLDFLFEQARKTPSE